MSARRSSASAPDGVALANCNLPLTRPNAGETSRGSSLGIAMNAQTALVATMLSGFFAVACLRASRPASSASGNSWASLFRFPGRIERLRRSRWQWFAMVAFMVVLRVQQQLPLALELMAALQFTGFMLL